MLQFKSSTTWDSTTRDWKSQGRNNSKARRRTRPSIEPGSQSWNASGSPRHRRLAEGWGGSASPRHRRLAEGFNPTVILISLESSTVTAFGLVKKNVLNNMPDFVPLAGGEGSATLLCCGSAVAPSCRGHVSIPFLTCRCNVSQTPLMCKLKLHPKPYPNESAVAPSCRGDGLPTPLRLQVKNTIFLHNFTGVLFN